MTDKTLTAPAENPPYSHRSDLPERVNQQDPLPNDMRRDEPRDIPAVDSSKAPSSALGRLATSRRHLRDAFLEIAHPPKPPPLFGGSVADIGTKLLARARSVPGIALAIDSAESWWQSHPMHTVSTAAQAQVSGPLLAPVAQRRPKSLLLAAFGIGAALVLARPWRMLLRPASLVGVVSQIVSQAAKGTSSKSWLQRIMSTFNSGRPSKNTTVATANR